VFHAVITEPEQVNNNALKKAWVPDEIQPHPYGPNTKRSHM
jgi:hypothetical protein